MKAIAKALGLKEDATEAEISARIAENSALTLTLVSEVETLKAKADKEDGDEAKAGKTKPAEAKKPKDDDEDEAKASDEKPVTKAEHMKLKKAHDKLQDCHDKLEDRVKDLEGKMKAKAKAEDDDKAKNLVENLVKTGRIADNEETKKVVLANLQKDYDGFSTVYSALPEIKKTSGTPTVNAILNLAAENKTGSPVKKSAIRAAMDEASENERKTTEAIK